MPTASGWSPPGLGCPPFTQNVYRVYNQRFLFSDSNHRYLTNFAFYNQMIANGWSAEGVVFCAPR